MEQNIFQIDTADYYGEMDPYPQTVKLLRGRYNQTNDITEKNKILNSIIELFAAWHFDDYRYYDFVYESFKIYIDNFEGKKERYLIKYPDSTLNDFYNEEIKEIEKNTISDTNPNIYFFDFCLNEILYPDFLKKVNYSQNRKLEFVKALQGNTINWHPKIFSTRQDFELFEMLQPKVKDILADYSYFYRRMFKENKIHAKPTPFAEWLNDTYEIADLIPKVKTLIQCETQAKKDIYETTKILYKHKTTTK